MKRLLIVILYSVPSFATMANVQTPVLSGACTNSSATCAVTVTSTGTGNAGVIMMSGAFSATITGVNDGHSGSWSTDLCPGALASESVDCAAIAVIPTGVTSITVTRSNTNTGVWRISFWEISYTGSIGSFIGSGGTNSASLTPPGQALTLSGGTNYSICQVIKANLNSGMTESIGSPYTIRGNVATGSAFADDLNTTSGSAPTWTINNNVTSAVGAIAVVETVSGGTVRHRASVLTYGK